MEIEISDDKSRYINNSAVRTFAVLELIAKSGFPLSLSDITDATNLDKTTVRRFLLTLCDLGYVEKTIDTKYRITSRVLDLSSAYLRNFSLPEQSIPFLEKFCQETKTSASLGILDGTDCVYIAHVSIKQALSTGVRIGSRLPAHATAVGKVLLSFLTNNEIKALYEKDELPIFTSRTTTHVSMLVGALEEIRRQGFAISEEEYEVGVRAAACPILDSSGNLISAINVSTRTEDVPRLEFYTKVVPALLSTAHEITEAMINQDSMIHVY
ncbi:IclR family transcriptional regulator [Bacillus freudenreichii]|nr:IclR family transcriptional regulator [Bacillus freudenreichii]